MDGSLKRSILLYIITAFVLFLVAALLGLLMRFGQAELISLSPTLFYRFMTLHGLGMVVAAMLGTMAMSWFLLDRLPGTRLRYTQIASIYGVLVLGALGVVVAVLLGGVATGWTMLHPLPLSRFSVGQWDAAATGLFIWSVFLIGVGSLLFFFMVLRKVVQAVGSLPRALGWDLISGGGATPVPASVLPLTVSALAGLVSTLDGAVYLVLMFLEFLLPESFFFDRLIAKNLVYLFGHTIFNITIYFAAAAIYVILPAYTGRPWKSSRLLALAWNLALGMVLLAFFHHLYMDFVQPGAVQVLGLVASYAVTLPPMLVTIFGALGNLWRSGVKWSPAPTLIFLGLFGWALGGAAAALDATISFNFQLHNTLWVPAHFHTYLLLGVVLFLFAFVYHMLPDLRGVGIPPRLGSWHIWLTFAGGLGLVATWYFSGLGGAPRRFAILPSGFESASLIASLAIIVVAVGFLLFAYGFVRVLLRRR